MKAESMPSIYSLKIQFDRNAAVALDTVNEVDLLQTQQMRIFVTDRLVNTGLPTVW